jgi:hypothetical protein
MFKAIAMRGALKDLKKSGKASEIVLDRIIVLAKVKRVNFLTVELDYLADDLETVIQTGIISLGSITEIRSLSLDLIRLNLLRKNPELALDDSWDYFFGVNESEFCDEEEDD